MQLSNVYKNMVRYALVYHTQPNSEEVEFITHKFFYTHRAALKWLGKKYPKGIEKQFIQPEVVKVSGFNYLCIED